MLPNNATMGKREQKNRLNQSKKRIAKAFFNNFFDYLQSFLQKGVVCGCNIFKKIVKYVVEMKTTVV